MDVLKKIQKIKRQSAETLNDAFNVVRGLENREEIHKWIGNVTTKTPCISARCFFCL